MNPQLKKPLDIISQKLIAQVVDREVRNVIFNTVWDDYFYYSTFIESVDRYDQSTGVGGSIVVNANGLNLDVDTSDTDHAQVTLDILDVVSSADILKFDKETRFRTQLKIDDVSEVDFTIGGVGSVIDGIEFQIDDGVIKGTTISNSSVTNITLGSVADDTYVKLEYRYLPSNKVDFYVDDVISGTIRDNLPRISIGTDSIFGASIEKNAASAATRTAFVMFYDLMQKK